MNKLLIFCVTLISTYLYAVVDAMEQSIDHHKGNITLYDVWRLLRIASKVTLIVSCFSFFYLLGEVGMRPTYLLPYLLFILATSKPLWNYFYSTSHTYLVPLDNTLSIKTGIPFLDRYLGLGKPKG